MKTLDKAHDALSPRVRDKFSRLVKKICDVNDDLAKLAADDELGAFLLHAETAGHLHQAIQYIIYARPHSLCRFCEGAGQAQQETCIHCKGHGWLPYGVGKQYEK